MLEVIGTHALEVLRRRDGQGTIFISLKVHPKMETNLPGSLQLEFALFLEYFHKFGRVHTPMARRDIRKELATMMDVNFVWRSCSSDNRFAAP